MLRYVHILSGFESYYMLWAKKLNVTHQATSG